MPYVPSKKTDGKSTDREVLDAEVKIVAQYAAERIKNNLSLIDVYEDIFYEVCSYIYSLIDGDVEITSEPAHLLGSAIYHVGERYKYEGAFLGELNYAITRFIQLVPKIKVERGEWKDELRYWLYAATVEALTSTAYETKDWGIGVSGVFEDIKDEYKRRVNQSYEAAQIIKSGDCYDTPYYDRLASVEEESGREVGHIPVFMKWSKETVNIDLLPYKFVLKKK